MILPGTGRWCAEGVTEGARLSADTAPDRELGPLNHFVVPLPVPERI